MSERGVVLRGGSVGGECGWVRAGRKYVPVCALRVSAGCEAQQADQVPLPPFLLAAQAARASTRPSTPPQWRWAAPACCTAPSRCSSRMTRGRWWTRTPSPLGVWVCAAWWCAAVVVNRQPGVWWRRPRRSLPVLNSMLRHPACSPRPPTLTLHPASPPLPPPPPAGWTTQAWAPSIRSSRRLGAPSTTQSRVSPFLAALHGGCVWGAVWLVAEQRRPAAGTAAVFALLLHSPVPSFSPCPPTPPPPPPPASLLEHHKSAYEIYRVVSWSGRCV